MGGAENGGAGGESQVMPFHGLYLSATGSDVAGDGTVGKPFASLAKVAGLAQAGDTVVFLDGVYNPFVGGTLPDGVDVMAQTPGAVTLNGNGGVLFNLAGSSRIEGIVAQSFDAVVQFSADTAATGTVTIVDSTLKQCKTQCLRLAGSSKAVVTAAKDAVVGDGGANFAILTQQASLSMVGGMLQNVNGKFINATDDAVVSLQHVTIPAGTGEVVLLDKKANVTLDDVKVSMAGASVVTQKGASSLVVKDSDLSLTGANRYHCLRSEMDGVGSMVVTDTKLHGCGNGFSSTIPGALTITRVDAYDMSFSGMDMGFGKGGIIRITDSNFHDCLLAMRLGGSGSFNDIKVRGSTFVNNVVGAWDTVMLDSSAGSTLDFGTRKEPGGNTFSNVNTGQTALRNGATGVRLDAVGNTFMPNLQKADGAGHYTAAAGMKLEVAGETGRNYAVPYQGSSILLVDNP